MKRINFIAIVILFLIAGYKAEGQEIKIRGYVTTFDSIPLINAEIKALRSKNVAFTDSLGNYEISCLPNDKIKVSAYGFVTRKVKVNDKTRYVLVNLELKPDPESPDLAIGYGHVKDADKLLSVSALHNAGNNFSQYSNIFDLIRGQIPGVEVVNKEIIIRGKNSFN